MRVHGSLAVAAGALVYVVGGEGDDRIPLADVQFARIDPATGHPQP